MVPFIPFHTEKFKRFNTRCKKRMAYQLAIKNNLPHPFCNKEAAAMDSISLPIFNGMIQYIVNRTRSRTCLAFAIAYSGRVTLILASNVIHFREIDHRNYQLYVLSRVYVRSPASSRNMNLGACRSWKIAGLFFLLRYNLEL
ncbi:hypothetical protein ALC57_05861 [Trachymyrmex cornetzi]|uniref:Uncharacterized protein n=1 Tax=Trachymyrmex cornetzi TaxID=471704 RepID=A0A151J9L7_9HYME|nr:hypothetical protein ALC57_05861 [Trachymyrmex cornetzi]